MTGWAVSLCSEHMVCTVWYLVASQEDTVLPIILIERPGNQMIASESWVHPVVVCLIFKCASKAVPWELSDMLSVLEESDSTGTGVEPVLL